MREKLLEQKLKTQIEKSGGLCLKFVSPSFDGMPDRMILFPEGTIAFAEIKAPGKKPRPLQMARITKLRNLGFRVYVVDSEEMISELVKEVRPGGV